MGAFSWGEEVWRVDAAETGDLEPLEPLGDAPAGDEDAEHEPPTTGDGGFSDSRGIVRVWLEAGRLSRIRVSSLWRSKLGRRTLADCFTQALASANLRVADEPEARTRSDDDVDFSQLPPFGTRAFAAFTTLFDEVEQRWEEALHRRAELQPSPAPAATGTHKGVTVSLNPAGLADRVTFDKVWLQSAGPGDISTHVMRAAGKAYGRFVPTEEDRGELDDIEAEHEFLLAAFKAMLNPKER